MHYPQHCLKESSEDVFNADLQMQNIIKVFGLNFDPFDINFHFSFVNLDIAKLVNQRSDYSLNSIISQFLLNV